MWVYRKVEMGDRRRWGQLTEEDYWVVGFIHQGQLVPVETFPMDDRGGARRAVSHLNGGQSDVPYVRKQDRL